MNKPELSVLMCTYNSEKYISETIQSILNQTFSDFEFIIIDDGSTDFTEKVVKSFNDRRIKYYKLNENLGIGKASNFGLTKVSGKYVARADSDDIYDKTRFEKQKKFLDENKDFCMVGSLIEYFSNDEDSLRYKSCKGYLEKQTNSIKTYQDMNEKLYWYCCLVNSVVMGRTDILKKFGYGNYRILEDYKLFYCLNKNGYKISNIDEVLCRVRVRGSSISFTNISELYNMLYEIKKVEIDNLLINDTRKTYIWGAGGLGRRLYELFTGNGYEIYGFVDGMKEKWGEKIFNKTIESPYNSIINSNTTKVIVASDPGRFEIADYLKQNGYVHLKDYLVF